METLATSALLLPFAIATNFLGIWLVRRVPNEHSTGSPMR